MLRLQAHAEEAGGDVLEARDAGEDSKRERDVDRTGAMEHTVEDTVREDLEALWGLMREVAEAWTSDVTA